MDMSREGPVSWLKGMLGVQLVHTVFGIVPDAKAEELLYEGVRTAQYAVVSAGGNGPIREDRPAGEIEVRVVAPHHEDHLDWAAIADPAAEQRWQDVMRRQLIAAGPAQVEHQMRLLQNRQDRERQRRAERMRPRGNR